jgi:hypothetical protein
MLGFYHFDISGLIPEEAKNKEKRILKIEKKLEEK